MYEIEVLNNLGYGRGILLVLFIICLLFYYAIKK